MIVTDITQDVRSAAVLRAIVDGVVDAEILGFIGNQIESDRLINVTPSLCLTTLRSCLAEALDLHQNLLVYYTGHGIGQGKKRGCLMTNHTVWTVDDIIQIHVDHGRVKQSIVWLMDCCGLGDLGLPYRLVNGRFRIDHAPSNQGSQRRLVKRPRSEVIFITATSFQEKSVTSASGSAFTRLVIGFLQSPNTRGLDVLVESVRGQIKVLNTGYQQTIGVVASLPLPRAIPGWLYVT